MVAAPIIWFGRYRFYNFQANRAILFVAPQDLEGYTDKLFYTTGDTIKLFVRAKSDSNFATVRKMTAFNESVALKSIFFPKIEQVLNEKQSEFGCNWENPILVNVDNTFEKGYYNLQLKSATDTFNVYFIVGDNKNDGEIVYLANTSTWTAYNSWGGKSLYENSIDQQSVYYVSTLRPNIAFGHLALHHSIEVEAHGYNWFSKYYNVDVYPDYILEQNPELLANKKVIVLAYHTEYFSSAMYSNLEDLIYSGRSLLALGANQIYKKIKWRNDYTLMESRRDLTFHDDGFLEYGGLWYHRFRPPERFLGARYTGNGIHSFAPYTVTNSKHWLYNGLDVKDGDLFGEKGIDGKPISGLETDKVSFLTPNDFQIIAKGINPAERSVGNEIHYPDSNYTWDGAGGSHFGYRKLSDTNAILNSAAIHSIAGLGVDSVFSTIVKNFLDKYFPK